MSKVAEFPDLGRAREQAADWISRSSRGLTAEESAEFRRWRASPANARALQQLSRLWTDMDVLRELSSVFPEPPVAQPTPRETPRRWRTVLAASLVLAVLGAGVLLQRHFSDAPAVPVAARVASSVFSTAVGEQRNVPLPDGSALAINTASQVQVVSLGRESRELRLVRGEAHFTVAHDAARPFRVSAAGHVVQALGTAFDVRLLPGGGLEVIVTDGHVKLLSGDGTVGDLLKDQYMRIGADGSSQIGNLSAEAIASRLSWRTGMLVFEGQSLDEVLAEFSRYTRSRFVVTSPALRKLRIGGYFAAGDTTALRDALKTNFGIDSRLGADGVILIGPEPAAATLR